MNVLLKSIVSMSPALCALVVAGCDDGGGAPADAAVHGEAPLSNLAALMEGAPTNEELPFDLKADGFPPRQFEELLAMQSPVKSQGSRGVCSIFSSVALMEHLYMAAGATEPDFSEQYLQWSTKFEVGAFPEHSGSSAYYNLQALSEFGIPLETAWPYEPRAWDEFDDPACGGVEAALPTRCHTNGSPPALALDAERFFLPRGRYRNSTRASLMDHMQVSGTSVVVDFEFFYQAWNHRTSELPTDSEAWAQGVVRYPNDEDIVASREREAGHSVLLVGWDLDKEVQRVDAEGNPVVDEAGHPVTETGFYLVKNSWGTDGFGVEHPAGPGYGWLSMEYIDEFGRARVSDIPTLDAWPPAPTDPEGPDEPAQKETYTSIKRVEIPDSSAAGASAEFVVSSGGVVGTVDLRATIEHSWRGDLLVRLVHAGTTVVLQNREGGSEENLELDRTLTDFAGTDRNGPWTLELVDTAASDTGALTGWTLSL